MLSYIKNGKMEFLKKNLYIIIGALAGAVGGFLYWKLVGCQSGTCPIKSVWYWSTLYGALIGGLFGSLLNDFVIKLRNRKNQGDQV
jgi:H+/Cl- antiporter ClcA